LNQSIKQNKIKSNSSLRIDNESKNSSIKREATYNDKTVILL
jgi:hypothetical protein